MGLYETLPLFAQNWACTWAGYRRSRARFTPEFHRRLAELERSIALSRETLEEIQWERLQAMVGHARQNVPYYSSLAPPSIENHDAAEATRETLASIPPLEKEVYRERPGEFLARNLDPRRLIRGKTSGTTATALPLWYTSAALAEEFATVWRGMRLAGARLTDPNLTFNGQFIVPFRQEQPPFWRHSRWNRQTLFSLYHCKSEHLFGAPVYDRYGVSEFCVSMTQCSERNLHVDMEFGIVEVEVTEESENWVRGPLLVTGFANEATPLLRYRVGDIGTRAKAPCPCGRAAAPARRVPVTPWRRDRHPTALRRLNPPRTERQAAGGEVQDRDAFMTRGGERGDLP
jgi:phenylacetate-coenzyme A ligase PaaK-like adenylate-forming protein